MERSLRKLQTELKKLEKKLIDTKQAFKWIPILEDVVNKRKEIESQLRESPKKEEK